MPICMRVYTTELLYMHMILCILQDYRRLNVAITRAKSTCILVGNADTLSRYTQHYDQHDRNSAYAHTFAELVDTVAAAVLYTNTLYSIHSGSTDCTIEAEAE
jgi:AAA domain